MSLTLRLLLIAALAGASRPAFEHEAAALRMDGEPDVEPRSRGMSAHDTSAEGESTTTMGEGWRMLANGFTADLESIGHALANAIGFRDSSAHDHVKLRVASSSAGCGPTGEELVRNFYINSAEVSNPSSFAWCGDGASGGACKLSLELGGPTLHHDIGMLRLRGCPLGLSYTAPYLRIMKVLYASFDVLHLGWGACDGGETVCELGEELTMRALECKTLGHPTLTNLTWDVCHDGPGSYR